MIVHRGLSRESAQGTGLDISVLGLGDFCPKIFALLTGTCDCPQCCS